MDGNGNRWNTQHMAREGPQAVGVWVSEASSHNEDQLSSEWRKLELLENRENRSEKGLARGISSGRVTTYHLQHLSARITSVVWLWEATGILFSLFAFCVVLPFCTLIWITIFTLDIGGKRAISSSHTHRHTHTSPNSPTAAGRCSCRDYCRGKMCPF